MYENILREFLITNGYIDYYFNEVAFKTEVYDDVIVSFEQDDLKFYCLGIISFTSPPFIQPLTYHIFKILTPHLF